MELKIFDYDMYNNDLAAHKIVERIVELYKSYEGMWLYREPEIKTEGDELPTFTLISPKFGIIFIKAYMYNDENLTHIEEKFWTIDNQRVRSEFVRFRNYTHKIKSMLDDPMIDLTQEIAIRTIYVFPYINNDICTQKVLIQREELFTCNYNDIVAKDYIQPLSKENFDLLESIIQTANIINNTSNIYVDEPAKNMFEAIELNNKKIARFDYDQMEASLTITDKSERIRGLAGSGKTILLAMKAAKLHKRYPDKKIAFVFYTKSLYNQANSLIRKYYNLIANDEPNWDNLKVLHSWGGTTTGEGFYTYICREYRLTPKTFRQGSLTEICNELVNNKLVGEIFDYILIDEAQDFPLEFFLLVQKVAKAPKKVVIAYDELQTTNDVKIPEFETLFGTTNGNPNIVLEPQHDYILKKSYRNTLDVLVTAFSFGFGFYHNITQIIQDNATWEALGFESNNEFKTGNEIIVKRPVVNSPNSIQDLYGKFKPISCTVYNTIEENAKAIADEICLLITAEKVKRTDILVIDIKMNKNSILNLIQFELQQQGVDSHIPGVVSDSRDFYRDNHVTLSTPRNAKGNEVPIVFVVGCEDIYDKSGTTAQRQARNFMFISITRSKGWVYISAVGKVKGAFYNEFDKIKNNIPNIRFLYPNEEKRKELAKIDFLTNNPKAIMLDTEISRLKKAIDSGDIEIVKQLIALDPELKSALLQIIGG